MEQDVMRMARGSMTPGRSLKPEKPGVMRMAEGTVRTAQLTKFIGDMPSITNNMDNTAEDRRTDKGIINNMDGTVEERRIYNVREYCTSICRSLGLPPQDCLRMCQIQIFCKRHNAKCEVCYHRCLLKWTFGTFTFQTTNPPQRHLATSNSRQHTHHGHIW